ncbi:MAG TPA: nuclear transport factor 2 family protein [Longimicrobium sp.]|nr:nuclear transport factor 2 family protein [Longimicrobium sp.]
MRCAFTFRRVLPAGLILILMTTTAAVLATPPSPAEDRQAVADVVAHVALDADAREWAALRSRFADRVEVDYSSLTGQPAATVDADALMAGWSALLPGFDATQHLLGPVVVEVDGDRATAHTHVRATHRIAGAAGGELWVVGGRYTYGLVRTPSGWRVASTRLELAYQEGNTGLAAMAQARAGAAR